MPASESLPKAMNLTEPGEPTRATAEETATLALQYQGDAAVLRAIDGNHVPQHLPVLDTDGKVIANYSVTGVATETPSARRAPFTFNTVEEQVDMVMVAHHLDKDVEPEFASVRSSNN